MTLYPRGNFVLCCQAGRGSCNFLAAGLLLSAAGLATTCLGTAFFCRAAFFFRGAFLLGAAFFFRAALGAVLLTGVVAAAFLAAIANF